MKALLIIFAILIGLVMLPVLLIGGALLMLSGTSANARRWLDRLRGPNGLFDKRRNVRVITRGRDGN